MDSLDKEQLIMTIVCGILIIIGLSIYWKLFYYLYKWP